MEILQPSWAWTPEGVLQDPYIEVLDGQILRCSTSPRHPDGAVRVERLEGRLVLPGLVNAHSHAFQRAFRGHVQELGPGGDDFWSWRRGMYGVANSLSPEGVFAVSRLAFLEMVEAGVTHVGEFHYLHRRIGGANYDDPDELSLQVVEAAASVGLRLTLLWVAYGRGGPDQPLLAEQSRFGCPDPAHALEAVDRLATRAKGAFAVGLAPHSVRAIPPSWWREFANYAGVLHAHVAEQPREVALCRAETGMAPLALLEHHGCLSPRFTAVHLTYPELDDAERLARHDASVCVCPSTEMDLGDGFLPEAVRTRVRLCLGSDSQARIDVFAEARDLEMHGRGVSARRLILGDASTSPASAVLSAATAAGARSLGASEAVLREGQPADLVAIDLRHPAAAGVPPLEAAAFVADASWVSDVWVGGVRRVQAGRHPDRQRIVREAIPFLGLPSVG